MIAFICIEKLNAPYRPFNYLIISDLLICRENHYALLFVLSFVYFLFSAKNQKKNACRPRAWRKNLPKNLPADRLILSASVQFDTLKNRSDIPISNSLAPLLAHKVVEVGSVVVEECLD